MVVHDQNKKAQLTNNQLRFLPIGAQNKTRTCTP